MLKISTKVKSNCLWFTHFSNYTKFYFELDQLTIQSVPIENWWGPKLGVRVKILKLKSISQKNSLHTSPVPSHKISEHPECRILHCIDNCRLSGQQATLNRAEVKALGYGNKGRRFHSWFEHFILGMAQLSSRREVDRSLSGTNLL